jgi:hypothetical protein
MNTHSEIQLLSNLFNRLSFFFELGYKLSFEEDRQRALLEHDTKYTLISPIFRDAKLMSDLFDFEYKYYYPENKE